MLVTYKTSQIFPDTQTVYMQIQGELSDTKIRIPPELIHAHATRKKAFIAGRLCAQGACAQLGVQDVVVGQEVSGRPQFPAGLIGSISHSDKYAFSIAGRKEDWYSLGIDVEKIDHSARQLEAIEKKILTIEERKKWGGNAQAVVAIFTIKEAAYKCINWIYPCRTNSFEVMEMDAAHVEVQMRDRSKKLSLLTHTELDRDLQHHISIVALPADFSPNLICK